MTNGHDTEANAIPVNLLYIKTDKPHRPPAVAVVEPSYTPRPSGKSAPALNAADSIAIQRLTPYNFVNNGGEMCEENIYLEKEKKRKGQTAPCVNRDIQVKIWTQQQL
jgi:hypothetical protein